MSRQSSPLPLIRSTNCPSGSGLRAELGRTRIVLLFAATLAATVVLCGQTAKAQTLYWSGAGTWGTSSQWSSTSGGPYTSAWVGYDAAVFQGTAGTVTVNSTQDVNSLLFTTTGYTLTGGTLEIGNPATPFIAVAAGDTATINSTLADSATTPVLTIGQAGDTGTLILGGTSSGFTKAVSVADGILDLTSANPVGAAGMTVVSGAELQLQGASISYTSDAVTLSGTGVSSAGALDNNTGSNTWAGLVTLGAAATINSDSGTLTLSNAGTITGSGDALTVGGVGNTTINSIIGTGAGALTKSGTGTLTLSGVNTYSGGTTLIGGGTLVSGNGKALGAASTVTFGTTHGQGNEGTLQFTANPTNLYAISFGTNYTNSATIQLNYASPAVTLGVLTLSQNNTLNFTTGSNATGSPTLAFAATGNTFGAPNNITSSFLAPVGVAVSLGAITTVAASPAETSTLNLGGTSTGNAITGVISNSGSGATLNTAAVTMSGTGSWTLSGANTYTGATTVTSGTLVITAAGADYTTSSGFNISSGAVLQFGSNQRLSSTTSQITGAGTFQFTGSGIGYLANNSSSKQVSINMSAGGSLAVNSGTLDSIYTQSTNLGGLAIALGATASINVAGASTTNDFFDALTGAGTLTLDATGTARTIFIGENNGGGTFSGVINTASLSLTKAGTGTEVLSGANTYAGNTLVGAGTLALGNNLALQNSALDTSGAGIVTVTGFTTPTFGGLVNGAGAQNLASVITTGYSAVTGITLNPGTGVTDSYSGAIADGATGMTLTKSGAGTQTLSGANTYTGATTVSAGTLALASPGSLANTAVSVSGGALQINGNYSIGTASLGTATLAVGTSGVGTLTFQNSEAAPSALTLNNSTPANTAITLGGSSSAAVLNFNYNATGTDTITTGAMLAMGAGGATVNLSALSGSPVLAASTYNLLSFATSAPPSGFVLTAQPSVPAGDVAVLNATATAEQLIVTTGAPVNSNVFWNGGVDANWNTGATGTTNWVTTFTSGMSVGLPGATNNVFFTASAAGTSNLSTNLGQAFAVNSVSFTGTGTGSTNSVTIGGTSPLTINAASGFSDQNSVNYAAGIGLVMQSGAAAATVSAPVVLGNSQTWEIDSANGLTVSGAVSGAFALTKTGTGTLSLTGANTYSGATTVTAGTLNLTGVSGYQTTALSVASGATLGINMTGASSSSAANAAGTWCAFDSVNAAITGAGVAMLNGTNFVFAGAGAGSMTTNLSAGGVLDITGGSWQWGYSHGSAATNLGSLNVATGAEYRNSDAAFQFDALTGGGNVGPAYTGAVTLTLGVSNTQNNATFGVSGNTATFSGVIKSGDTYNGVTTGALSLIKVGTGTQVLSGANTYTGSTTVNGGTLLLNYSTNATVLSSSSALVLGGGTLSLLGNSSGTTSQTLASLALTAGTASSIVLNPSTGTSTTLTITSGTLTTGAGSAVNFNYSAGTTIGPTVGSDIVAFGTAPTLASGIIGGGYSVTDTGGSGFATVNGSKQVIRLVDPGSAGLPTGTGASTTNYFINSSYSTSVTTTPGSLVEALSSAVAANTVTVNTTGLTSGAQLVLGANILTLTSGGGMLFTGANPYTITATAGGGLTTSAATGSTVFNNYSTSTVTIGAPILISGAGPNTVTFTGPGTTILTGTSTYTGLTTITNGSTLQIGSAGSLASSTTTPITDDGTLQYSSSAAQTFLGLISGTGVLIKNTSSTSTLTLSDTANTFSGGLTISASSGTVIADTTGGTNTTGLGTGPVSIGSGSTLNLLSIAASNVNTTINNTFTGAGALKVTFSDTTATGTSLGGLAGFTGTIELANSTASNEDKWGASGVTTAAPLTIDSGSQLYVTGTDTFSGGITVQGIGNNELRGAIRLASTLGGNIKLAASTTIGTEGGSLTGNITSGASGGQTLTLGGTSDSTGNATLSGNIGGGTSAITLTQVTSGTVTLSGTNTYSGGTNLNAGTLILNGGTNTLLSTSTLTYGGAATLNIGSTSQTLSNLVFSASATEALTGSSGTLAVNGGTAVVVGSVGNTTTLNLSGVTATFTPTVYIGQSVVNSNTEDSSGTVTVATGTTLNASILDLAYTSYSSGGFAPVSTGILTLNGGSVNVPTLTLAEITTSGHSSSSASATVNLNTGATLFAQTIQPGASQAGTITRTINWNGGTIENYAGDNLTISAFAGTTSTIVLGTSGTPTFDITSGRTGTVNQIMSGTGSLTKIDSGELILAVANTYSGATNVTGGELLVSGTGAINSSTGITINGAGASYVQTSSVASTPTVTLTAGTLGGTGTVGVVNVANSAGAIVQGGNGSGGTLTTGNLSFAGAATVNLPSGATLLVPTLATNGSATPITVNAGRTSWNGGFNTLIDYTTYNGTNFSDFTVGTTTGLTANQAVLGLVNSATNTAIGLDVLGQKSGVVTWGAATTISANINVFNVGTAAYGYNFTGTGQTVNGVTFTGTTTNSGTIAGGALTLSGLGNNSPNAFTSGTAPFASLSAAYQAMLVGGDYVNGATAATITLNSLISGHAYATQFWVNDPRGNQPARTETITSTGGNTVTLSYPGNVTGAPGQYTLGGFTAASTFQAFTITGNSSSQINAVQVRDVTGVWSGATNGIWDSSGTSSTNLNFTGYNNFSTVQNLIGGSGTVYFADTDGFGNAVTNSAITVATGGVSTGTVVFQNNNVNYSFTSADANGITGGTAVNLTGTGTVTFNGVNTYTGATTISSGTLAVGSSGSLGTTSAVSIASATNAALQLNGNLTIGALTGTGTLAVGGTTGIGTLTFANSESAPSTLTVNNTTATATAITLGGGTSGAAVLNFNYNATGTDTITTGGKLVMGPGGATVNLSALGGATLAAGTYPLVSYATSATPSGFVLASVVSVPAGDVAYLNATSTAEQLIVTTGAPAGNVFWNGGVNAVWNTAPTGTTNWVNDFNADANVGLPDANNNVFFTASAAGTGNLTTTLGQGFEINSLSFTGTGSTAASNSVAIGGTSPLQIDAASAFTDQNGANYAAGIGLVVQSGSAAHTISAPVVLANSQAWEIDSANGLTVSGVISGAFALTKTGIGTLTLSGNNTYTGATNVNGGILVFNTPSFNTYRGNGININNGSTVDITQSGGSLRYDFNTTWTFDSNGGGTIATGSGLNFVFDGTNTFVTNGGARDNINGSSSINMNNGPSIVFNVAMGTDPTSDLNVPLAMGNSSGGLTLTGTGRLTLSGANTYTGQTSINQGTLLVNAGGTLGATGGAVTMGTGAAATIGTVGNLTINTNTTIGSLAVVSNTSDTTTSTNIGQLSIASGNTLTIGSTGLSMGVTASSGPTNTALGTGSTPGAGGTLTVNGPVTIGPSNNTGSGSSAEVIDLSGLSAFNETATSGTLTIGFGLDNTGTLKLASGSSSSNTINVGTISLANTNNNNSTTGNSVVSLGTGTNLLEATTITLGLSKGGGVIQFASSGGSVTIGGTSFNNVTDLPVANITLADNNAGTYEGGTSGLLLAGHSASVFAGTVIVAEKLTGSSAGVPTAAVTFDTGSFNVVNLELALLSSTGASGGATGSFTLGGPTANSAATGVLNVTGSGASFILADNTDSTTAEPATGTFTINGGTANINTAITVPSTTTTGTTVTTLTLAGGTLNMMNNAIGGTGVSGSQFITNLNFQSGTLENVSQINGGAVLNKTTSGTLILAGTNAYTGGTTVSAGTLRIGSPTALGANSGAASVTAGAVLDLNGTTMTGTNALTLNGTGISSGGALTNSNSTAGTYAGLVTLGSSGVSIGGTGTIALSNTGTIAGSGDNLTLQGAGGSIASIIGTGAGMLTVNTTGVWTLSGANTFSGGTTVTAGTLMIGNSTALGANTGAASVANGAVLDLAGTTMTGTNGLTLNGTGISSGGALTNSSGTGGTYAGLVTLGSSGVSIGGAGTIALTNTGTIGGSGNNLTLQGAGGNVASIVGTGTGSLTVNSTSVWQLSGANTFTGGVNVNGGTLRIGNAAALNSTTPNAVSFGGSATLDLNGYGTTVSGLTGSSANQIVTNSNTSTLGPATLTYAGATPSTFAGTLQDGGSTLALNVASGALTLSGNNTYSGGTTISGGTLRVANVSSTSATGSGSVTVSSGTLSGTGAASTGFISGTVSISNGAFIAPSGGSGVSPFGSNVGTLTVGALTLGNGAQLNYQSNGSSFDSIAITGTGILTVPASGSAVFNFYTAGTTGVFTLAPGVYDNLMTSISSVAGGGMNNLSVNPADLNGNTATFSVSGGGLDLTISVSNGSASWSSSGNTDYGTASNWTQASGPNPEYPNGAGQIATFGTGSQMTVSVNGAYTVGQLNFNNSISQAAYYLTGSGSLTLNNSGSGASVNVGSGSLSPTIVTTLTLADSSLTTTFNVASGSSLDVSGTINESTPAGQKIVLAGGGMVTMEGVNTYTGGTTIQNGTLMISQTGVPGTGSMTFSPGSSNTAVLDVNTNVTLNNLSETPGSAGTAQLNVLSGSTLTLNQSASASFAGALSLGGNAGLALNQGTGNTLTISGAPTLNDGSSISVNSGTLAFTNSAAATINGSPTVSVASGATLQLAGSAAALSSAVNITTHGNGSASDGALTLVGNTTQTVGIVSGDTLSGTVTAYSGNTTVGDGTNVANLTATQILQNTLTINAGSTVTIAPSGSGIEMDAASAASSSAVVSGASSADSSSDPFTAIQAAIASGSISSVKGQQLENRIAAIERLAATDPGLDVSLLEDRVLAAIPSSSIWSSTGTSPLAESGSGLLAVDSSASDSALGSAAAAFAPSADFGGSPAAVPEPSTLLLAALGGIGILIAIRRRSIYCGS